METDISSIDRKIISMYERGLRTRQPRFPIQSRNCMVLKFPTDVILWAHLKNCVTIIETITFYESSVNKKCYVGFWVYPIL